jgi:hypothetical protein
MTHVCQLYKLDAILKPTNNINHAKKKSFLALGSAFTFASAFAFPFAFAIAFAFPWPRATLFLERVKRNTNRNSVVKSEKIHTFPEFRGSFNHLCCQELKEERKFTGLN